MKRMRVSGGKIRAAFYHNGVLRSDVLADNPNDWDAAYVNLVELRAKLKRGEDPKAIKSTFEKQRPSAVPFGNRGRPFYLGGKEK